MGDKTPSQGLVSFPTKSHVYPDRPFWRTGGGKKFRSIVDRRNIFLLVGLVLWVGLQNYIQDKVPLDSFM